MLYDYRSAATGLKSREFKANAPSSKVALNVASCGIAVQPSHRVGFPSEVAQNGQYIGARATGPNARRLVAARPD
jgi:hypothetical protein